MNKASRIFLILSYEAKASRWWSSSTPYYYQSSVALHFRLHPRSFFQTMLSGPTFTNTLSGKLSQIQHMDACKYPISRQLGDNWRTSLSGIMSINKPPSCRIWLSVPLIHLSWEQISIVFSTPTVLEEILCESGQRKRLPHTLLCEFLNPIQILAYLLIRE